VSLEVVRFAEEQLSDDAEISGAALASEINSRLGVAIHKRTVEKLLTALRARQHG
jgi:hypothetical protein